MWEYIIRKYKGVILFTIGSLLIVFALYLALYSRVQLIKEQVFSEVEFFIENEKNDNEGENNNQENDENPNNNNNEGEINNSENNTSVDINTEYVDDTNNVEENKQPNTGNSTSDNTPKKVYIGYLEIPRISLRYGFVAKDSYYNHVDRNIQIIKESDFPDVENGNLIIAGHSGNAKISYFKNLFLLK